MINIKTLKWMILDSKHKFVISMISSRAELLNLGFDSIPVSTSDLVNLLSVFVELECRHGLDSTSLSSFFVSININFDQKCFLFYFISFFSKFWGNHLAWWAPRSSEINNNKFVWLQNFIEFCFSFKISGHLFLCLQIKY